MILMHGEVIDSNVEQKYLTGLYEECTRTLAGNDPITTECVITACDKLYRAAMQGAYDEIALPLLQMANLSYERFQALAKLFCREELEYKCKTEFGEWYEDLPTLKNGTGRKRYPLGVLFHIAAGNVDGLPAYSVIEGLLAGNINILKLPTGDNGLSVKLLSELIRFEPRLKDYIYVFDVPSAETETLKVFAELADAVVVWGGDEAVAAARQLAGVNTKIIPWGHKLSFAYVTEQADEEALYGLARHICETNQVLCSSCQGIFLDTENREVQEWFAEHFFALLLKANEEVGKADIGMRGKNTLRLYTDSLEVSDGRRVLQENGVSVVIKEDSELELSYLFRNVWIKRMPRKHIVARLKRHKGHLQTCGLLCGEEEKTELSDLLGISGVVRITGSDMSRMLPGEAHDGIYPLREYSRIVETD